MRELMESIDHLTLQEVTERPPLAEFLESLAPSFDARLNFIHGLRRNCLATGELLFQSVRGLLLRDCMDLTDIPTWLQ
jgi:hypothetical protein